MTTRWAGLLLSVLVLSCDRPPSPAPPSATSPPTLNPPLAELPPEMLGGWDPDVVGEPGPIPPLRKVPETSVQRAQKLYLVTLNSRGTLGELLEEVRKQTGLELKSGEANLNAPARVEALNWPVARVLNQVGLEERNGVLNPYSTPAGTRYLEGLRLSFSTRPWEPEGKRLGWIIKSDDRIDIPEGEFPSTLTWNVASIDASGKIPFETCDVHSPGLVYVPMPNLGSITVQIRGHRTWYLDVPLEFRKPKPGDVWKGHGFEIVCSWPNVEVRSDRPLPVDLLTRCLREQDFVFYLPDGRQGNIWDSMGVGGGGGGGGRYGGRFGEKPVYAWCGCRNAPTKTERSPTPVSQEFKVHPGIHVRPITAYETIRVDFRALISEEFEVTSEPLRTDR